MNYEQENAKIQRRGFEPTVNNPYSFTERKEAQRYQRVFITADSPELKGKYQSGGYVVAFVDSTDGDIEIELPDAESSNEIIKIKRTENGSNTVTAVGVNGQTINTAEDLTISGLETYDMVSDGENWWY